MTITQAVKNFISKKHYDWEGNITVQNFHPQLEICFAINGIFFNKRETKLRFIWPVLSILLTLIGTAFQIMFIWHGLVIKDYQFATECFCYLFILGSIAIVYSSVLMNRKKIFLLVSNMNDDFQFVCDLGGKYRETFLEGQIVIWKLCWAWSTFSMFIAILYISSTLIALLYQSTLGTHDEHMVRPLIFPMWLPKDDPYRTPNYEIFMLCQIAIISILLLTFGVYVYILFHLLLHYYILMDMILIAFGEFFDGLDESVAYLPRDDPLRREVQMVLNSRMRQIVTWHNSIFDSVKSISLVCGPTLVYQMMFSSIVICLIAYQVASQLEEGKFDYLFAALGLASVMQLWIPCYIGTLLRNRAFSLAHGCWNSGWHETPLGRMVRQDFVIFILRAQQPVAIKFIGLPHVQLETFSSVMSTAYSYFNMLRQYN